MTPDYADLAFEAEFDSSDPEYGLKKTLFQEIKQVRDKHRAAGLRRFALRRAVREEMATKHSGRAWEIIKFLLTIFSIVLFFI